MQRIGRPRQLYTGASERSYVVDRGALISIPFFGITGGDVLGACRANRSACDLVHAEQLLHADDVIPSAHSENLRRILRLSGRPSKGVGERECPLVPLSGSQLPQAPSNRSAGGLVVLPRFSWCLCMLWWRRAHRLSGILVLEKE